MTDKKIKDYLERAIVILKLDLDMKHTWSDEIRNMVVEIAKMIQLEEQHQDLLKLSRE